MYFLWEESSWKPNPFCDDAIRIHREVEAPTIFWPGQFSCLYPSPWMALAGPPGILTTGQKSKNPLLHPTCWATRPFSFLTKGSCPCVFLKAGGRLLTFFQRLKCHIMQAMQVGRYPWTKELKDTNQPLKGIVQPFELGGVTSLLRWAVKFCKAGHFQKKFLMIQSHERSLIQNSAA